MPWPSKTTIEARRDFVGLAEAPNANIRALCRRFNISPKVGYKVLNRFRVEGEDGLQDRSRRPKSTPLRTSDVIEAAILAVRAEHPLWGPRKIAARLSALGQTSVPAPSTIGAILVRHGKVQPPNEKEPLTWFSLIFDGNAKQEDIATTLVDSPDLPILLDRLQNGSLLERKRSIVILANRRGIRGSSICRLLKFSPQAYRRCLQVFDQGGAKALFARKINPHRKFDNEEVKKALFGILHQPPSNFGINRTAWIIADLSQQMTEAGKPASEDVIRTIIKQAGYRWRKARVVLTSNDPEYSAKVAKVGSILANLAEDEAFFSIDEFGPFAVKAQPGRALVGPGERRIVPQWQKSRGCLILTAAIELSANQITHFYSSNKNTAEMIRMMHVLADQYRNRRKIYLSWDAASWHISKELFRCVNEHNAHVAGPEIETVPLPKRAQFLNVIEAIFSGLARAVIHNSDYQSVDEAKAAIDRYFDERNAHYRKHPKRAGGKIWKMKSESAEFSELKNCKDPRFG